MKRMLVILIICFAFVQVKAQDTSSVDIDTIENKLVQFSGVVVSGDSLEPLPFVHIFDKDTRRGTVADYYGYFSFVAHENDTIVFSSIGYKQSTFIIPDTLTDSNYSLIHLMETDTIQLSAANVYPWPTREQFEDAFVNLDLSDDLTQIALKNVSKENLQWNPANMSLDSKMSYQLVMQKHQNQLYNAGLAPTTNLFNPLAWVQFIDALKKGKFKKKK